MMLTAGPLLAAVAAICGVAAAWAAAGEVEYGLGQVVTMLGPGGRIARLAAPLLSGSEELRPERRLVLVVLAVALAVGWLLLGPLAGLAFAAGAPAAAGRVRAAARRRRRERLAEAAPMVARALADALAGGHSVRGALAEAVRGVPAPASDELERARVQLALGDPTDLVLERLRQRAAHPAYDSLCAAILLQRESGGDLAGLLRSLGAALEDHVRAEADARALTAQARFTALIVAVLPAIAALLAELAHPGYLVSLVGRPLSAILVATSVALQLLAWVAVRRIARGPS